MDLQERADYYNSAYGTNYTAESLKAEIESAIAEMEAEGFTPADVAKTVSDAPEASAPDFDSTQH